MFGIVIDISGSKNVEKRYVFFHDDRPLRLQVAKEC